MNSWNATGFRRRIGLNGKQIWNLKVDFAGVGDDKTELDHSSLGRKIALWISICNKKVCENRKSYGPDPRGGEVMVADWRGICDGSARDKDLQGEKL